MKEIKLTQGKVALVDDEDFEWLNKWKWQVRKGKTNYCASRGEWANGKVKHILMHRLILGMPDCKTYVDHIDMNGLNNQRGNIRLCTCSQNCANRRPKENSSSCYLGVSWNKKEKRWVAQIRKNWVKKFIGYFKVEKDAALAYNEMAKQLHGEFANLNIVEP